MATSTDPESALIRSLFVEEKMQLPILEEKKIQQHQISEDTIQQIYEEKKIMQPQQRAFPLSILLPWISGRPLPPDDQDVQARCWIEKMNATSPPAFALAFLDYLRTEYERVLAGQSDSSSCAKNEQIKSPASTELTRSPEEQAPFEPPVETEQANRPNVRVAAAADNKSCSSAQMCERLHPRAESNSPAKSEEKSYDANFPVLGAANPNVSQTQSREKPRRRVNPTPLANPVVDRAFVFAKLESSLPLGEPDENKPKSRSSAPLKVDIDVLMRRCEKSGKLKHKSSESGNRRPNQVSVARQDQSSVSAKDRAPLTSSPETAERTTIVSNSNVLRLKRFATVHAKLINSKMVPSLVGELQFLFQLLCMGECPKQTEKLDAHERLFQGGDDCSLYSCIGMEQLGRILDSVGEHILSALIQHPAVGRHSPALLLQMKGSLASHQVAALHSFKAYKVSSSIPNTHPHSNKGSLLNSCRRQGVPGMPISVPFQAARDSRNNFRSRESQKNLQ